MKMYVQQLQDFLDSPFKDDVRFAVGYIVHLSRDSLNENIEIINSVFYDRVFKLLTDSEDD